MGNKIGVLNPMGFSPEILQRHLAPRPTTLTRKTVYLVDYRFDDGDILIAQMPDWFGENRTDANVEVRWKSGVYTERDEALYKEI